MLTTLFLLGELRIFWKKNFNKAFKCLFFCFCSFIIVCMVKKNIVTIAYLQWLCSSHKYLNEIIYDQTDNLFQQPTFDVGFIT